MLKKLPEHPHNKKINNKKSKNANVISSFSSNKQSYTFTTKPLHTKNSFHRDDIFSKLIDHPHQNPPRQLRW